MSQAIAVALEAVILAVTGDEPRVLAVTRSQDGSDRPLPGLPSGQLDVALDRTLDRGLRRWVSEQTGIDVGYVEQLYTFGDRYRDPAEARGGPRILSIAYLALVTEEQPSAGASWIPCYDILPWEDHRDGAPQVIKRVVRPAVERWVADAGNPELRATREERADVAFGLGHSPWDPVRVLSRYELLYELGLVPEAGGSPDSAPVADSLPGTAMVLDHRRIVATALERLRGKLSYRPVVFELLPETFTLFTLQRLVEALAGVRLHKQNFRRLVERSRLVEGTGRYSKTGGRPAELYSFRREVVRERSRPGVGFPR